MSTSGERAEKIEERTPAKAWRILVLGLLAQAAGTFLVSVPAFLVAPLHSQGMTLSAAGLLASAPTFGMVLTLVAWGALADRRGERGVIAVGLVLTAALALGAALVEGFVALAVMLALGGAATASANAASGRIVVGWFPRRRRGLAMGIRQMSQPLGVAAAALVVPPLVDSSGTDAPLLVAAGAAAVLAVACWFGLADPPRPRAGAAVTAGVGDGAGFRSGNPYLRDGFLARIHALSMLLVVPQFTLSIFGLVWLTTALGWDARPAGLAIAVAQVVGALGRIAVGQLSDRVGSRVRVLRWVAVSGVVVMAAVAATDALAWSAVAGMVLVLATAVSVADNGLAFTSVAEVAGPGWSGKALGVQNTGQFVAASSVGPGVGALVGALGFPVTFALVALAPLAALALTPRSDGSAERPCDRAVPGSPGVDEPAVVPAPAAVMR